MKTKKQYTKQLLSIVLSIIMLLSLIPSTVFATETDQKVVGTSTISNSPYLKGNTTFNEVLFNATRTDFRDESVYNLIITRFYDGDSSNNVHCWDDGTAGNPDTDPGWRGDFKGLIEKLDYIKALGFTALRLTPVAQNASGYDYHGYHPINLKEIDYRFESEGYTYEDLIDACHAKGLKVMQEVVINNTSNFGEENLRNLFDVNKDADWSDMTEALVPTDLLLEKYPNYTQLPAAQQFQARMDLLRESLNSDEIYHRETNMNFDNYLSQQGSMAGDCIDLNTENPVVALYLAESCFNYAAMGVDAIMLMSASYINRWTLNEGILPLLKDMLDATDLELDVYIEMVDRSLDIWNRNNPSASVQFYTWKETESQWQNNWDNTSPTANIQTSIDHYNAHSTLGDEPTSNNAVLDGITYHTPDHSNFSGMHIYDYNMMWNFGSADSAFNIAKYGDQYVNDATWNLTSVDNVDYGPDGMEKYRYSQGTRAWAENLNLMYTLRGIPSILYGTEIEFQKDVLIDVGPNLPLSKTGRAYYGDNMEGSVTSDAFLNFTAYGKSGATLSSPLSAHIRQLNAIRMSVPALRKGQYTTDGKYVSGNMAFIKRYTNESEEIDSLALVTITDAATFKNIPNGKYIDAVTGDVKNVTNGTLTATPIGRGNMRVYVCCANGFTGLDASEMPAANRTLRFSANGGLGTVNSITVEGSEKAVLPECTFIAPSKTAFFGWNVNGTIYQPGDMVDISVNSMARAVWQSNANTVTFVADGAAGGYEKDFKHGEVITIPTSTIFEETFRKTGYTLTGWQGYTEGMTMPLKDLTFTAVYAPCEYTVTFDQNGGELIKPITVTFGEKYGSLPSSAITGLSGGNKNWYLVDADGNVTETNIKNLTLVSTARDHKLFIKRNVLTPSVSIALTVPGGISDGYQYYIPGASKRVLTATIGNMNTDILEYTYRWYKDGTLIEGATSNVLTLDGNVSDSGTYKVEVTVKLKDGTNIVVGSDTATASEEQKVKILHATNTLSYDANGGEGGPQSSYTGGTSLNVSKDVPTRAHHDFIGWNTASDGTGDSYKADDAYTFVNDNGNGGCEVTLYAQWKLVEYTVTYKADGEPISTETVGHGKDANLPAVPAKNGYVGKWDSDGKNITGDTTITVVYTEIPVVKPNEVKPEDKTDLEDAKAKLEEILKDDFYTDEDKKSIQDAIDDIDDALEVIGNVEAVEESIVKLPAVDTVKPDDEEAIKAITDAQTAYNALSDYEKSLVDEAAKANLDKLVAALVVYDIVEGDGSSWTEDSNHNITFVVNGLFSKFVGIKVDGKDVDKANYEVKAGSTIITLKASYLDTLAVGKHTITVVYTDGSTDGTFNVHAKANSPATGDNSHMFLWIALLFISGGAVITLTVVDRKRRMASNR